MRPEIEVEVSDGDGAQALLAALGYRAAFRYQKFREVWDWKDAEIVRGRDAARHLPRDRGSDARPSSEAARVLGVGPDDYVLESYPALFRAAGGRGDMVF